MKERSAQCTGKHRKFNWKMVAKWLFTGIVRSFLRLWIRSKQKIFYRIYPYMSSYLLDQR